MKLINYVFVIVLTLITNTSIAQEKICLSGWKYRREVNISNPDGNLKSVQIKLELNTKELIDAGKLLPDGRDIRVHGKNGAVLIWIDPSTLDSPNTSIWMKADLEVGKNTFFLFYGNTKAGSVSDGDKTFAFFEDFETTDLKKWTINDTRNINQNQGRLEINGRDTDNTILKSNKEVKTPVFIHTSITSSEFYTDKGAFYIGFENDLKGTAACIQKEATNLICSIAKFNNSEIPNEVLGRHIILNSEGDFNFSWYEDDKFKALGIANYSPTLTTGINLPESSHIGLGFINGTGNIKIDYIFATKYHTNVFSFDWKDEEELIMTTSVNMQVPDELCEGQAFQISADQIAGATYLWKRDGVPLITPNKITQNLTASDITAGVYSLQVEIASTGCDAYAESKKLIVHKKTESGIIQGDPKICETGQNTKLNISGYLGKIDQWEYSFDNGAYWSRIDQSEDNINIKEIKQDHYYRAKVTNGTCPSIYTSSFHLKSIPISLAGKIEGDHQFCEDEKRTLNLTSSRGDIEWFSSSDKAIWSKLNIKTSNIEVSSENKFFKAIVKNDVCPQEETNIFEVKSIQQTYSGEISTDQEVCPHNNSGVIELKNNIGKILYWETTKNKAGNWTSIQSNSNKLNFANLNETSFYRAVVNQQTCDTLYSPISSVIMDREADSGILNQSIELCENESTTLNLLSYKGIILKWQFSNNGKAWSDSLITTNECELKNQRQSRYFRVIVNSKLGLCDSDTSNIVYVKVYKPTKEGDILTDNTRFCSNNNKARLNLNNYIGNIQRWEYSENGLLPWISISNNTDSLKFENLSKDKYYRAILKNGVCSEKISEPIHIQIDDLSQGGQLSDPNFLCAGKNQASITLSSEHGKIQKWEQSANLLDWNEIMKVKDNFFNYQDLTDDLYLRVIVKNGVCPADTSTIAHQIVHKNPVADFLPPTIKENEKMQFVNKSTSTSGKIKFWNWNFGTEETSLSTSPFYTYKEAGDFTVKLKVETEFGCLDSTKRDIHVNQIPKVDFKQENVCFGNDMFFTNTSSVLEGIKSVDWDFGDETGKSKVENPIYRYNSPGTYKVKLIVESVKGVKDSISKTVKVYYIPKSDFNFQSVCLGNSIVFSNQSEIQEGALRFRWLFGDGSQSDKLNPTKNYQYASSYTVQLHTESEFSCSHDTSKTVYVHPVPEANFTVENVPFRDSSFFKNTTDTKGTKISSKWNFDDGTFSNSHSPKHLYELPATYIVNLKVVSDSGCHSQISQSTTVMPLPVASFSANPVCHGYQTIFQNTSQLSKGELSFQWDFGNGITSSENSPNYTYPEFGTYKVRLIALADHGGKDTVYHNVTVNSVPIANFQFENVCDKNELVLENLSKYDNKLVDLVWDFGDETNSLQFAPKKTYLNPGNYEISLRLKDINNCGDTLKKDVQIYHLPYANFSINPVCIGSESKFKNLSGINSSDNITFKWNLGDTKSSNLVNPVIEYSKGGIYEVKLNVESEHQCKDSITKKAYVFPSPLVYAGADTTLSKGEEMILKASGAEFYSWWGDLESESSESDQLRIRPMNDSWYHVRGIDENNCINSDSIFVHVKSDYKLAATNILTPDGNGDNDAWFVENIDAYESCEVSIYNRWGQEVYHCNAYKNDWKGVTANGDLLPDGTYYYVIKFTNTNKIFKGALSILRND